MARQGSRVDSYSLSALLTACREGTESEAARALNVFVAFQHNARATVVCNAALDLCAKQGLPELALTVYKHVRQPDVITCAPPAPSFPLRPSASVSVFLRLVLPPPCTSHLCMFINRLASPRG